MLLIDAGNSRVKCHLIQANQVSDQQFRISMVSDEGSRAFRQYLQKLCVENIYLASVASDLITQQVTEIIHQLQPAASFQRLFTQPKLGGIKNAYHDHTQLGVDRWLTLLAARELVQQDVIIIDAGSAITIDLLSLESGHLGGAILAGLNTDAQRFREIFSHLDFSHPLIKQTENPGRSTLECIHLTEGMNVIDYTVGIIERWSGFLQLPVTVLLCGQDASHFQSRFKQQSQTISDLVFTGMLKQIELQG